MEAMATVKDALDKVRAAVANHAQAVAGSREAASAALAQSEAQPPGGTAPGPTPER